LAAAKLAMGTLESLLYREALFEYRKIGIIKQYPSIYTGTLAFTRWEKRKSAATKYLFSGEIRL
jgi:hypothetical protein